MAVTGRLDLEELAYHQEGKHAGAPFTLGTEVDASVANRSRVAVNSWALRALDGKKLMAQTRLVGSAEVGGAMDLSLDIEANDLSELVDRFGLLTERQHSMISGGNLKGDVRLVTAGAAKPLTVKAGLRSANLNVRLDKSHQLTRTVDLQAEMEVDGDRTMADLRRVEIDMESSGIKAGKL